MRQFREGSPLWGWAQDRRERACRQEEPSESDRPWEGAGAGVAVANWGRDSGSSLPHARIRASAIRVKGTRRSRGIGVAFRVCCPIGCWIRGRRRLPARSASPRCLRAGCRSARRRRLRPRGSVQASYAVRRRLAARKLLRVPCRKTSARNPAMKASPAPTGSTKSME